MSFEQPISLKPTTSPGPDLPGAFSSPPAVAAFTGPPSLERASNRLRFPPSYVIVGIYRLATDKSLRQPAWDKCKHGTQRGLAVGFVWTCLSFHVQRAFIAYFFSHSARVTGLSHDTFFGYKIPFSLPTYAAVLSLSSQVTLILTFFLSRNIRIARERAYDQTVLSRGKGPDFWAPYVEEWVQPPFVDESARGIVMKAFETSMGRFVIKKLVLFPISLYPFVGVFVSAYFKALATAKFLHKPYFAAKKMNSHQVTVFMEERKWDYRIFGFVASLLEGLPIIGLVFTVSNRIGAAMWAHDLEKRQHAVAAGEVPKIQPPQMGSTTHAAIDGPPPPYSVSHATKSE